MGFFSETIAAKLADREIAASYLVFAEFRETPRRWWHGFGTVRLAGHDWIGTGELIGIEGLEQPVGTAAPKTTFTLSGIDATIVQMVRQASDRVKDRRITVYVQFWDVADFMPLDQPYAVWSGKMDQISYAARGSDQRTITLTAESVWVNRKRPPYGFLTDRDQNARFPGDRGLEQVVNLVSKTVRWPIYVFWALAAATIAALAPLLFPLIPPGEA